MFQVSEISWGRQTTIYVIIVLENTSVYVKTILNAEFLDIYKIHDVILFHPTLSKIPFPVKSR